ncbi:MAG: hypothetical protein L6366_01175, partial [Candidatus Omnitrophica bacterium]|nr:hypothetical protein [Candidatus Omnitrophota bacterium]
MPDRLLDFSNYLYNPHAIPVILVGSIIFCIGLFILLQSKKQASGKAFFLFCVSLSIWLITIGFVYCANNPRTALLWYKYFTFFGVVNIMPSGYLFVAALTGLLRKQRALVAGNYVIANIFYALALVTEKFIALPRWYYWGYYPRYERLNILFIVFYLTLYVALQIILWRRYKSEKIPIKRTRLLAIFIGFLVAFIASVDFTPKFFTVAVYPFGFIPMLIFVCILAYSIIHYKAFDIETVIHKTAAWVLASSTCLIPIALLVYWLRPWYQKASPFEVSLLCAGIFYLLTIYVQCTQPKIDHFFQRRKADLEETLDKFSEDLVYLKGLNNLIRRIEQTIADTLYPQYIAIFIHNKERNGYVRINNISEGEDITADFLEENNQFLSWLAKSGKIVYKEFVNIDPQYTLIEKEANDYFNLTDAMLAIPLVLNVNMLGIINLGKKANFKKYRASDLYFLN